MNWKDVYLMEAGTPSASVRAAAKAKRRRRRRTAVTALVALLAVAARWALAAAVRSSARAAAAAGEQCWPLAGGALPAVVLLRRSTPPQLLWRPRYVRDESPGDVIRAHERSVLCPGLKTRIRPKRVNVTHFPWRVTPLADKEAVCVTHYSDFFATGVC